MSDDDFPEARLWQAWAEFESGSLEQCEHGISLLWTDVRSRRYDDASEMILRIGERQGLGKLLTQCAVLFPLAAQCIPDFLGVYEAISRAQGVELEILNGVPKALAEILRSGLFRDDPAVLDAIVWRLASIVDWSPEAVPHLASLGVLDEARAILDLYATTDDYRGLCFKTTWLVSLLLADPDCKPSFAQTRALVPGLAAAVLSWPVQSLEYAAPALSAIFAPAAGDVQWPLLLETGLWPRLVTLAVSQTRSVSAHAAQIISSAAVALGAAAAEGGDLAQVLTPATLVTELASLARALVRVRGPNKLILAHLMAALRCTAAAAPAGGPCGATALALFAASDPLGPSLPVITAALGRPTVKFSEWDAAANAAHTILALLRTYAPGSATPAQLAGLAAYLTRVGIDDFVAAATLLRTIPNAVREPADDLAAAVTQIQSLLPLDVRERCQK